MELPRGIKDLSKYVELWLIFEIYGDDEQVMGLKAIFSANGVPLRVFEIDNKVLTLRERGAKKKIRKILK